MTDFILEFTKKEAPLRDALVLSSEIKRKMEQYNIEEERQKKIIEEYSQCEFRSTHVF